MAAMLGSLRQIQKVIAAVVRAKAPDETWLECSLRVLERPSEGQAIEALSQLGQALGVAPEAAQTAASNDVSRAA